MKRQPALPQATAPASRILYDDQIFRMQPYGGISRYFCELAGRVGAMPGLAARVLAPLHVNAYLAPSAAHYWGIRLPWRFRGEGMVCRLVNRLLMPTLTRFWAPQLLHVTYYPERLMATPRQRVVVTVYDMIHERLPATFAADDPTSARKRAIVQRADRVICISQHTAEDLIRLFAVDPSKVVVIPLGFSREFGLAGGTQAGEEVTQRPYLLYVGARPGHKNFGRLLAAYGASPALQARFDLLAFGGGALTTAERAAAAAAGVPAGQLRWVGGDDQALAEAYRQARLFVYPSSYEGFGIPPLEAMSCGCPVVCSNTSSIPEVVGGAGQYFDPDDTAALRAALEAVALDDGRHAELRASGLQRCQDFSWQRCAEATANVYRSLLETARPSDGQG